MKNHLSGRADFRYAAQGWVAAAPLGEWGGGVSLYYIKCVFVATQSMPQLGK